MAGPTGLNVRQRRLAFRHVDAHRHLGVPKVHLPAVSGWRRDVLRDLLQDLDDALARVLLAVHRHSILAVEAHAVHAERDGLRSLRPVSYE